MSASPAASRWRRSCLSLLRQLCDAGYAVSLETAGAHDISGVDARVVKVMDLKAPGSGESQPQPLEQPRRLTPHDQIKIVLADRADYDWARGVIAEHALAQLCDVLLSPVHGKLAPRELAEWILADRLPVRMQIQLHKILWGEEPGH